VGFDEWMEYMLKHEDLLLDADFKQRVEQQQYSATLEQVDDDKNQPVVLHDREGLPRSLSEKELLAEYQMGPLLGKGKFAAVYVCTRKATGEKMAAKIFEKNDWSKQKIYQIIKEAIYARRCSHQRVCGMLDCVETPRRAVLLMEMVTGGELYKAIYTSDRKFTEKEASNIVREVMEALAHMHRQHLIHCDLKPENILCTSDPTQTGSGFDIKITDFGLSKPVIHDIVGDSEVRSFPGSPLYKCPEMLARQPYSYSADLWSLGIIMFELLCGHPPFGESQSLQEFKKTMERYKGFGSCQLKHSSEGARVEQQLTQAKVSSEAQDLLAKMLHPDGTRRITAADALNHPWLGGGIVHSPSSLQTTTLATSAASVAHRYDGEAEGNSTMEANPNARDRTGNTALHYASKNANPAEIQDLLSRGSDVNSKGWCMSTPLHCAAKTGSAPTVEMLLDKGADVTAVDANMYTALHFAAATGSAECTQLLVERGALIEARTKHGKTAMELAEEQQCTDVINVLSNPPSPTIGVVLSNKSRSCCGT